tara:strand:+ start:766 stop:930 length:165 start_codon:yes stop_codon:yes gene_type:complete
LAHPGARDDDARLAALIQFLRLFEVADVLDLAKAERIIATFQKIQSLLIKALRM